MPAYFNSQADQNLICCYISACQGLFWPGSSAGEALQLQLSLQKLSSTAPHLHPAPSLHGHTHGLLVAPLEVAGIWCPERCSEGSTRKAPCPPKPAGYEVMNAMGYGGARWGGRLAVTPNSPTHQHCIPGMTQSTLSPASGHRKASQPPACSACLGPDTAGLNSPPAPLSVQGEMATRKSQIKPGEEMTQVSGHSTCSCVGAGCFLPSPETWVITGSQQQSQALLFADFLKPQNGPSQTGTGGEKATLQPPAPDRLHQKHAFLPGSAGWSWAAIRAGYRGNGYSSDRWFVQTAHTEALRVFLTGCCSPPAGVPRCAVTPARPGKGRGAAQQRMWCHPWQPC